MASHTPRVDRAGPRIPPAVVAACLWCVLAACTMPGSVAPRSTPAPPGLRPLPDVLNGVTLDDVSKLPQIVSSLKALPVRPTERIVFDPGTSPSDYAAAVNELQPISYLMAEPLDSAETARTPLADSHARTAALLTAFGSRMDIWEVGNEVNGEWAGSAADVTAKMADAYHQVAAAGGRTAITLYYNPNCYTDPANQMLPWARDHVPQDMRDGLDYVLVSYYEDDCKHYRPPLSEWNDVFTELAQLFPHAHVGFGENGTARDAPLDRKLEQLTHYYTLPVTAPRYLGGHFWWYYAEDMLPYPPAGPMWAALSRATAPSARPVPRNPREQT